jgi:hypothetical protein
MGLLQAFLYAPEPRSPARAFRNDISQSNALFSPLDYGWAFIPMKEKVGEG